MMQNSKWLDSSVYFTMIKRIKRSQGGTNIARNIISKILHLHKLVLPLAFVKRRRAACIAEREKMSSPFHYRLTGVNIAQDHALRPFRQVGVLYSTHLYYQYIKFLLFCYAMYNLYICSF